MSALRAPHLTLPEYLTFERGSEERHAYYAGEVFAMSGASRSHNRVNVNLSGIAYNALRGGPCEAFSQDMRVKVDAMGLYTYPDLSIVCGESQFEDDHFDTLLNPLVLVEILSPSTEAYDRGKKFEQYRQIPSLRAYVLISQDRPVVEVFTKSEAGTWVLRDARGLDASIRLDPPGLDLALADLYERVVFPEADVSGNGSNPSAEGP